MPTIKVCKCREETFSSSEIPCIFISKTVSMNNEIIKRRFFLYYGCSEDKTKGTYKRTVNHEFDYNEDSET